ncbi:MAG: DNA-protecting protein DprA [Chloroflexi bacterium]|nr:DNA-protecting protein DprA [Chloroflexota bacterium]
MNPAEVKYWVGFTRIPGVGRARMGLLEQAFGTLSRAWDAPREALQQAGLDRRTVDAISRRRELIAPDQEMEQLRRFGVRPLTWHDEGYPELLREIPDGPPVLYVRGELLPEDRTAVAVVGTRKATPYGREATAHLVRGLARSKVTIVSGLARGIDTEAHKAALDAGGRTIAVLGCGLDLIYPAENAGLAREVLKHGAMVSEHPLGVKPEATHFPRRNRIMSGLSLGVLVVEAGEESGAHITVRFALEQDREVFAVPGSIFAPGSRGANRWIQEGAKLVSKPEDILEELNLAVLGQQLELRAVAPATATEKVLLGHLAAEPVHIDEMVRRCGLSAAEVSSTLALMELKGLVRQLGGMHFALAR